MAVTRASNIVVGTSSKESVVDEATSAAATPVPSGAEGGAAACGGFAFIIVMLGAEESLEAPACEERLLTMAASLESSIFSTTAAMSASGTAGCGAISASAETSGPAGQC